MSDQYLDERGVQKLLEALKPHIEGAGGGGGVGSVSPITNNLLAAIAKGEYVPAEALGMDLFLNTPGLDTFYRYIGPRVSGGTPVRAIAKADYMALSDLEKDADVLYILTDTTRRYPTSLNLMSWADISKISADGTFKNYFKVGDTKRIYLNGRYYTGSGNNSFTRLDDVPIDLLVVGIDHNQEIESPGEHRVHWLLGMVDGKNVCIDGSNANYAKAVTTFYGGCISVETTTAFTPWKDSALAIHGLGIDRSPSNWSNMMFGSRLPDDLRAVLKPVKKVQAFGDTVDITNSYMTLPAITEIFKEVSYTSLSKEANWVKTYEYYLDRVKYQPIGNAIYPDVETTNLFVTSVDILTKKPKLWRTRSNAANTPSNNSYSIISTSGEKGAATQNTHYAIRPLVFT